MRRVLTRRWVGAAAVTAAVAGAVLVSAAPASAVGGGNVAFDWSVSGASAEGLSDVTFPMTFGPETQRKAGIYVAQQFSWVGVGNVGYVGLQPRPDKDGRGQLRGVFSSFIAGTTSDDAQCSDGADGWAGVSCSGLLDAVYGHTYDLKVEHVGGSKWKGTAVDTTTGARTHLGSYTLPAQIGMLKPAQTGFLETYLGVPSCDLVPKTTVRLGLPRTSSGLVGTLDDPWENEACVGAAGFRSERGGDGSLLLTRGSVSGPAQAAVVPVLTATAASVAIDAAAVAGANRYLVRVDGSYAMESYAGRQAYGSLATEGGTTTLSRSVSVRPGSVLEVFLAPNAIGESSAGGVLLASTTYTGVRGVSVEGSRVSVALDADAQAAENRYLVRVDGQYLMESYSGSTYDGTQSRSEGTVTMSSTSDAIRPGGVVEVFIVPGGWGSSTADAKLLTTYTAS